MFSPHDCSNKITTMAQKYPLGIQTFSDIIENGYIYIDKSSLVYQLASSRKYIFLSRPRRFGKSLLLSTIDAYFSGRRELFRGLAIEQLEHKWESFPVLRIDLNNGNYSESTCELTDMLNNYLYQWESKYHLERQARELGTRFYNVLQGIFMKTGKKVVILIDEYDKPIIGTIEREKAALQELHRAILKGFYGTLEKADRYIRFAMLTGVSKFSHLSVFSDLNNLVDISLSNQFNDICGISEDELHCCLGEGVAQLARSCDMSEQQAYAHLKRLYDGYRFSARGKEMYNPWSLLNTLSREEFLMEWAQSGTPTFLVKMLHDRQIDLTKLDRHIEADVAEMGSYDAADNTIAALYQTGYLTIKDYDPVSQLYSLGIPNQEVNKSLNFSLLPIFTKMQVPTVGTLTGQIYRAAQSGNVDALLTVVKGIIASAPMESPDERVLELNYRNIIAIAFKLSGLDVHIEQQTCIGRIDLAMETNERVYIFEFKRTTLAAAQHQIESRHYADAYAADSRQVVSVAVRLDDSIRNIADWKVLDA